jgi:hypothetical protein
MHGTHDVPARLLLVTPLRYGTYAIIRACGILGHMAKAILEFHDKQAFAVATTRCPGTFLEA